MLDAIRRNAQSWGVKVIFGIIILVFVFWGVGDFRNEHGNILAEVNGSPLLLEDFQRIYSQTLDNLRRESPGINTEELERLNLRGQIFNQMVGMRLMEQEAELLNLRVSSAELRQRITQLEAFHGPDGQFDTEIYRALLQANNLTAPEFERDFRKDLLMDKIRDLITLPAYVPDQFVRDFFLYAREKVILEYISFPWERELDGFEITDEEIRASYEANLESFTMPARIKVRHLILSPASLARLEDVGQEEIAAYHADNHQEFFRPKQVRAAHILIKVPADAAEAEDGKARESLLGLLSRIKEGESFADLAREHSEDISAAQGGDLGWFSRGEMVNEFEEAAFALQPGEVSEPVRTVSGWHLIRVDDLRDEGTIPLEEVASAIRRHLAEEYALEALPDALDSAMEKIILGSSLEDIGRGLGLQVRETEFFSMLQPPAGLDIAPEAMALLFALADKEVTHSPILLPDGYLLAQKTAHEPETVRPLEEVRQRIVTRLSMDRAKDAARQKAEKDLALILAGEKAFDPEDVQTSEPFGRQGFIPVLGFNTELAEAAFAASPGEWLPSTYQIQEAFVLAKLKERIHPSEDQWVMEKEAWRESLLQARQRELFQAFMNTLQAKAEIRVLRQDVLRPGI